MTKLHEVRVEIGVEVVETPSFVHGPFGFQVAD